MYTKKLSYQKELHIMSNYTVDQTEIIEELNTFSDKPVRVLTGTELEETLAILRKMIEEESKGN